jgi:aspartyl/asparaginyl beta-hydroxylase (cupin superfamily)
MEPGSVISPHAGPTMERLRMHCAVSIPPNSEESYMRVGDKRVTWEQGECFVFKEYCEHEVKISNEAAGQRSVLILDLPNPFLKSQPQSDSNKNDEL